MIKGAIFDVDGTLLDSMYAWDSVCTDYLIGRGIEPREGLWETFKTLSLAEAARYYQTEYNISDDTQKIMDDINAIIERHYKFDVQPKKGVREFLELMKARNIEMSVATATDRHLIEYAFSRCALGGYFSEIFTCTSVGRGKDSSVIFDAAAKHMRTLPHQTLVFEDALYAAVTAKKAGYVVIGVYDSHESRADELKKIADRYITSFEEAGVLLD
ncbi:MAG: HAD family phosphatase [Clostridia bacterium]|nr:HAD family phosphatase [Clostridia bacterium]